MARQRLADKALTIAAGTGIQNIGQVAVSLFLVRILDSQDVFGTYRQVWLAISTLTPLALLGLPNGIYFFLPSLDKQKHRAFMAQITVLLCGSGLVFSVALFLGARAVAGLFDNPALEAPLRAAAFYPLFSIPSMLLFPFLVSKDRHARGAVVNLVFFFSQSILIVTLALANAGLVDIFRWVVLLVAARFAFSVYDTIRNTEGALAGPSIKLRDNLGYSIPVGLSNILTVLGQRLDKIVISSFLGTTTYAVYSVGAIEFPGIVLVSASSNTVMRPHISELHHKGDRAEIHRFWRESFRKQALVVIPMAVFLTVFAGELMRLLFTADYGAAAAVFQIYLAVSLFRIAPPGLILTSVGLTRLVLYGTIVYLAGNLALSLALVSAVGRLGPPAATFVATAGLMAYYALRAARYLNVPYSAMVPVTVLLRVGFVAAASAAPAAAVRFLGWGDLGSLVCGAIAFAIAYITLSRATRTLRDDDMAILLRWLSFRWLRGK